LEVYFRAKKEDAENNFSFESFVDFPIVSILVPAYNEQDVVKKTLQSIFDLDYPHEKLDVIIIDDGSTDGTLEVANKFISKNNSKGFMKVISHKNMGKAASLNKALELVRGEFFACLDADSFVEKKSLKDMLSLYYQENDPNLVIITPAMKVDSPKTFLQRIQWMEYLVMILLSRISSFLDCLYVAPGPFSLYRTGVIKELGGFDLETVAEDQEIAYRVQKQNYRIKHCPTGYVHTTAPPNFYPFYRQRRRWYIGSMQCAYKYRGIIGNLSYGDFGLIQMCMNVFGFLFGGAAVFLSIKYLFLPFFEWLSGAFAIGFDFIPFLLSLDFSFRGLFVNLELLLPFLVLLSLTLFFFLMAHKNSNEKLFKFGYLEVIPYLFVYFILVGGILLVSALEFGVKQDSWRFWHRQTAESSENMGNRSKKFKW